VIGGQGIFAPAFAALQRFHETGVLFHKQPQTTGRPSAKGPGSLREGRNRLLSFLPGKLQERLGRPTGWNWHLPRLCSHRLPWFHRASPSTTRNESSLIKSTNADRLIHIFKSVNGFFQAQFKDLRALLVSAILLV
jgi:hypothetical protein